MKIFVIPSWYPSASNPIYGTFVREQVQMMSRQDKSLVFGISLWGQGDDPFLLYARQPWQTMRKVLRRHGHYRSDEERIHIYFSPAYTWSRRLFGGNINGIVKANADNLDRFISDYGRPDILHVQASYPGAWIGRALSQRYGIPYLVTLRMSPFPFAEFEEGNGLCRPLHERLSQARMLIATSESLACRVRSLGLDHLRVVHNPVDTDFFTPLNRKQTVREFRLLAVGRLVEQKGFDLLVEAMARMPEDVSLDILGEGPDKTLLVERIRQSGLEERVSLRGQADRERVRDYMQACDGYVLASRHETFGNVLLEAMSCGKPSLATRCGGPEDILTQSTGLFCEVGSVEALAGGMLRLRAGDWDHRHIRQEAIDRFHPKRFTREMIEVYQECVRG